MAVNNVWGRIKNAVPGVPVANAYFLSGAGGGFIPFARPDSKIFMVSPSTGNTDKLNVLDGIPYSTLAQVLDPTQPTEALLNSRDIIVLLEDITEVNLQTPAGVNFVRILSPNPVQRYARWKSDNSAHPNIAIRGTGWSIENIYFPGGTAAACVYLQRDATYNGSDSKILNCVFNSGSCAIENNGACSNIEISGCRFINVRGGTATQTGAIVCTGTSQAVATNLDIHDNEFYDCDYNIAHSMSRSMVRNNFFQGTGQDGAATQVIDLTFNAAQGAFNLVMGNYLGKPNANYNNAGGFRSDANTPWVHNFATDQVEYSASGVTA